MIKLKYNYYDICHNNNYHSHNIYQLKNNFCMLYYQFLRYLHLIHIHIHNNLVLHIFPFFNKHMSHSLF